VTHRVDGHGARVGSLGDDGTLPVVARIDVEVDAESSAPVLCGFGHGAAWSAGGFSARRIPSVRERARQVAAPARRGGAASGGAVVPIPRRLCATPRWTETTCARQHAESSNWHARVTASPPRCSPEPARSSPAPATRSLRRRSPRSPPRSRSPPATPSTTTSTGRSTRSTSPTARSHAARSRRGVRSESPAFGSRGRRRARAGAPAAGARHRRCQPRRPRHLHDDF